jgi:hypothetical protein
MSNRRAGWTFELEVPEEYAERAEDLMEQLAMDGVDDLEEVQRRVEAWLELEMMGHPENKEY